MTYWDYKFIDLVLRYILTARMPYKLNRRITKLWSQMQSRKLRLWFELPSTRKGFMAPLWQDGAGFPKKTMAELKAEAKRRKR